MKRLILLTVTVILFIGCQNQTERFTTTSSNIDVVKKLVADYHAGDWEAWRSNYADTAKIFHNTWKKPSTPEEIRDGLKKLLSNTSKYHFDDEPIFYEQVIDDHGITWAKFWGNWRGTLKANGKELTIPVHIACEMVDGKIATEYGFYDLGVINAELAAIEMANKLPANEKSMIDIGNSYIKAWNDNDFELMKSLTTEDLVRVANGEVASKSQAGIAESMNYWHTAIPDFSIENKQIFVDGNKVYSSWTSTGTNTGNLGENPPTGKTSVTQGYTILTFNNEGKVIHEEAYYDLLSVMNQWGYSVTPPE